MKKIGFVRVYEPTSGSLGEIWDRYTNSEGMKYMQSLASRPPAKESAAAKKAAVAARNMPSLRRIFSWKGDELHVTFNMTALSNPACTRIVPPLSWLSQHDGTRVKVWHRGKTDELIEAGEVTGTNAIPELSSMPYYGSSSVVPLNSVIQLVIEKEFVEQRLAAYRMQGFTNEDLFRMLDKGPWVLSFSSQALPRLVKDLKDDIGFSQQEVCHIVSHCPYLVAQYSRYKGRDVSTTARALLDAGYDPLTLVSTCMRFPSMLAAPPDRIAGWQELMSAFGIARGPGSFAKFLSRASFMFYLDPPQFMDEDYNEMRISRASVATGDGYVSFKTLRVLKLIQSLRLHDLDKIVRTQPFLLLADENEVYARIVALKSLFADTEMLDSSSRKEREQEYRVDERSFVDSTPVSDPGFVRPSLGPLISSAPEGCSEAQDNSEIRVMKSLRSLITTYPAVLSIDHYQMKASVST